MDKVNYNNVADVYEYRYQKSYSPDGIPQKLRDITLKNSIHTILEVGCGTGHWLNVFEKDTTVIGIDPSFMMLTKANKPGSERFRII